MCSKQSVHFDKPGDSQGEAKKRNQKLFHMFLFDLPGVAPNFPLAHGKQLMDPSNDVVPMGQFSHDALSLLLPLVPALHWIRYECYWREHCSQARVFHRPAADTH